MKSRRIFIILGHPDKETRCGAFADEYEKGALEAGHEVRRINLGELKFDPILHKGYKEIQPLEPDLVKAQEDIKWAEHLVIFYPNWFCTMPALLKGFFDRVWLPGFAYHFNKSGMGWYKLLKGRSARIVITMGGSPFFERLIFGDYSNEIRRALIKFSGISPVRLTMVGGMEKMSDAKLSRWKTKIHLLGMSGM